MGSPKGALSAIETADHKEVRRREHHEADIVIVGAGILGCAAAVAFGKQGRSVILLERSLKEPDRIVGELLQPGGVRALEELGLRGKLGRYTSYHDKARRHSRRARVLTTTKTV